MIISKYFFQLVGLFTDYHGYNIKSRTPATTKKSGKIVYSCYCKHHVTHKINRIKNVSITDSFTYNGKTKKPKVVVKDSEGNVINSDNYTIRYPSGRKNVGKYTVKIIFRNDYKGTVSRSFKINPKTTRIKKLKAKKKAFAVNYKKVGKQNDGYQIQYATNNKFKKAKSVWVKNTKIISKTIKGLKAKNKYYV